MKITNTYILLFVIFLSFPRAFLAQNKKIDSLKIQLDNYNFNDTTRVNLLYDLSRANFRKDIDTTDRYLNEADSLSTILNYEMGKARVYYLKGMLENIKANYTESLHFFNKSLKYYEIIQDKKRVADVYVAFGITYYDLSRYDEAIKNYQNATKIYRELNNKREIVTSLINTGNVYSEIGNYKNAIANYKDALIISEVINDEDGISYVHSNLGVVYKVQGNYPLAIESFNKSLDYDKKMGDIMGMARMHNNLGETYISIKKYDKALQHLYESLSLSHKVKNKKLISVNKSNIGSIYLYKKEYSKAIEYFSKSLQVSQEINDFKHTSITYINIGNAYLKLGKPIVARKNYKNAKNISKKTENKRILSTSFLGIAETYLHDKHYLQALTFALQGQQIAKELDLLESQKIAVDILSEVYQNTKQYKKAFESYKEFKKLNDSLFNKENIERIAQLEAEYKYKQAIDSAGIKELQLTKTITTTNINLERTQRNYLWAIIGVLMVSMLLGSVIFYQKLRHAKAKTQNAVIEQKLLRSQMTPHFIFNSLSVLQGMILNKEEKKPINYLSRFSKLMRITLENSRDKLVLLSQELLAIENYLALQNLENDSYQYSITIDNTVDSNILQVPPMLIQPFVENAIEHAFTEKMNPKTIDINLNYSNKNLICTITDNGIGINTQKETKNSHKTSLSTTITTERLKILSKDLKMKGWVTTEDRQNYNEQGTIVTLIIPHKTVEA
ncbi:tetratricopeptide repeat protein [uncultured Wocania sp.]|uniref:tetratricopeptide repeat protein n=1 Tax=uncultured Wocania sp. TaxID=2834404 RepID=UPI0030F9914C